MMEWKNLLENTQLWKNEDAEDEQTGNDLKDSEQP